MLCNLMLLLCFTNMTNNSDNASLPRIVPKIIPIVTISRSLGLPVENFRSNGDPKIIFWGKSEILETIDKGSFNMFPSLG